MSALQTTSNPARANEEEARPESAGWLDWFGHRSPPHFGQLATWLLLIAALWLARYPYELQGGPRQGPATLLFWLPDIVVGSPAVIWFARSLLVVGAALWFSRWLVPWSCWLTALAFTALWSLHIENAWHTNHCFQMTSNLLIIQALWETIYAREIRAASAERRFWTSPLYPRWVTLAAVAYIGIFHTSAGLSKLWFSGPQWANGVSLQLWTNLWGYRWSPSTQLILQSRTFTQVLQIATLVIETAGILAVFPWLRTWIGVATVGFYIGVLLTFPYGFELNALFTALYLLPVEYWVQRWAERRAGESCQ